jgi:hypothetical protein
VDERIRNGTLLTSGFWRNIPENMWLSEGVFEKLFGKAVCHEPSHTSETVSNGVSPKKKRTILYFWIFYVT